MSNLHDQVAASVRVAATAVTHALSAKDTEIARLTAEVERLATENKEIRWKALRFDLDAPGIEQRERDAVQLVELRAEVERLRARCGSYERCLRRIASEDYRGNRPPSAVEAERALKERSDGQ